MENNIVRIRVNLSAREIELEGSEKFIEKYSEVIDSYLKIIKEPSTEMLGIPKSSTEIVAYQHANNKQDMGSLPSSFGEYYSRFPKSIKDVDKIIIAGYFCQQQNGNNAFSVQEASGLLVEQGVKLTNASASTTANLSTRRIFKHEGKYRISEGGIEHLKKLATTTE